MSVHVCLKRGWAKSFSKDFAMVGKTERMTAYRIPHMQVSKKIETKEPDHALGLCWTENINEDIIIITGSIRTAVDLTHN